MTKPYGLFDTEYTTWPEAQAHGWRDPGHHKEVFQIGATIVMPEQSWETFPKLKLLLKPVINPILHPYAVELVGVTQDELERDGLSTLQALEAFKAFAGDVPFYSNGNDFAVIAGTCGLQRVINPLEVAQFESLHVPLYQALHERFVFDDKDYPSGCLHQLMGIPLGAGLGQVHDPLRDVWSLHVTIAWLAEQGVKVIPQHTETS